MSFLRRVSKTRKLVARWSNAIIRVPIAGKPMVAVPAWMAAAALGAETSEGRLRPGLDVEFKLAIDAAVDSAGAVIIKMIPAGGTASEAEMAETLKEFMVAIGWESNKSQQKRFVGALQGATLRATVLGNVIEEMARKAWNSMSAMADSFDKLYFSTQRTGASAATIKNLGYAVEQLGGSADAAQASLEAMGQKLRENPGNITYLNALGFGLNKITGQLEYQRDLADKNRSLIFGANEKPTAIGEVYRGLAGMDQGTFLALGHVEELQRRMAENAEFHAQIGARSRQGSRRRQGIQVDLARSLERSWHPCRRRLRSSDECAHRAIPGVGRFPEGT